MSHSSCKFAVPRLQRESITTRKTEPTCKSVVRVLIRFYPGTGVQHVQDAQDELKRVARLTRVAQGDEAIFHFLALIKIRVTCPPLSGCSSRPLNSPFASIAASNVCASSALRTIRVR